MSMSDQDMVLIRAGLWGYTVSYRPPRRRARNLREAREIGKEMLSVPVEVWDRRAKDGTETVDARKNVTPPKGRKR